MNSENVKTWLIALLTADTTLVAALGSANKVLGASPDRAADTGVYVSVVDDKQPPGLPAGFVEARIEVYSLSGEAHCYALAAAVRAALLGDISAGSGPRPYNVDPATHHLRVWSLKMPTFVPPVRDGDQSNGYSGRFIVEIRARSV